jgi:hypothetical protein
MRVFLRNRTTRQYWGVLAGCGAEREQAFDFGSVPRAARFALEESLAEVEIVLTCYLFPDEVTLPVVPEFCDLQQSDAKAV